MIKVISRILALVLACSLFAVPVYASSAKKTNSIKVRVSAKTEKVKKDSGQELHIDIISHTINRVTAEVLKAEKEGRELKALAEKKAAEEKAAEEQAAMQAREQAAEQAQQYSQVASNQDYDSGYTQNYNTSYQNSYDNSGDNSQSETQSYSQEDNSQSETYAEPAAQESSSQSEDSGSSGQEAAAQATASSGNSASSSYSGTKLNAVNGMIEGPSGTETYYNLNMSGVVDNMQSMGIQGDYWVRDDGVKMYGDYVMAAANLDTHPYGSIVESSLGTAIVVDTGDFAENDADQLDIAVEW